MTMQFGVEIEFFGKTQQEVKDALSRAGIMVYIEGYNHSVRNHWKIITDCSVNSTGCNNSNGSGNEIVSPILRGEEGLRELELVLKVMDGMGCKVDKTCGLHVHHDINDMTLDQIKNIYKLYTKYQGVIDGMLPNSRRTANNPTYCKPIESWMEEELKSATSISDLRSNLGNSYHRYHVINFNAYVKYGTIEFRQHSGSVSAEKVVNWVKLTYAMLQRARGRQVKDIEGEVTLNSANRMLQRFKRELGLTEEISDYVVDRTRKLRDASTGRTRRTA